MKIFLPNNHSKWKIDYKLVSPDNNENLKKVFLENFSNIADSVISIEQVAETEVNSNNFKLGTSKGKKKSFFLLRRYPETRNIDSIKGAHEVLNFLNKSGLKTPEIILSDSGEEIVHTTPYHYTVFKFLKSNHFKGSLDEIKSAAREFGKMDALLEKLPDATKIKKMLEFPPKVLKLREFSTEIWENIFKEAGKHLEETNDEFDSKLLSFKDFILDAVKKTESLKDEAKTLDKQIIHFDLHPHNLLTDGKKLVAILDFDSLRNFPKMHGIAFAMHRLVRQYIVFAKPKNIKKAVEKAKEIFLNVYQKENPLTELEIKLIPFFLKTEALSRLSYAMKDFYFNGNAAWKGDLDKQTAAIAEAEHF
ncbi:MAG: phosphotransferase [Patescibacteria group bacterium]